MKILAISGSARGVSTNTALLRAMERVVPESVEYSILSRLDELPVFSPDSEGLATPPEVDQFMEQISQADGIIISSPEYVRAIPGGLKNAIDWMVSRFEVVGKPIALVHASHRGDDMLTSLRLVLSTVSDNFQEQIFIRFPLIGMSPEEVESFICTPERELKIVTFFNDFVASVRKSKNETKSNQ